jgi:hypothetical protein
MPHHLLPRWLVGGVVDVISVGVVVGLVGVLVSGLVGGCDMGQAARGSAKSPKFSLLKYFMNTEISSMDELARDIYAEAGKRVITRYQMDGAGTHTDEIMPNGII